MGGEGRGGRSESGIGEKGTELLLSILLFDTCIMSNLDNLG